MQERKNYLTQVFKIFFWYIVAYFSASSFVPSSQKKWQKLSSLPSAQSFTPLHIMVILTQEESPHLNTEMEMGFLDM